VEVGGPVSTARRYKKLATSAENVFFFFHLRCGNSGAKVARQLKVFLGSQIGSWVLNPFPQERAFGC